MRHLLLILLTLLAVLLPGSRDVAATDQPEAHDCCCPDQGADDCCEVDGGRCHATTAVVLAAAPVTPSLPQRTPPPSGRAGCAPVLHPRAASPPPTRPPIG